MMATINQKFVLVGVHAGKTVHVNGHEFVDGEMTFRGSAEQAATLERVLEFYGVMTAEKAELETLRQQKLQSSAQSANTVPELPGEPDNGVKAQDSTSSIAATQSTEDLLEDTLDNKPSLVEAIGSLDPETDVNWTSNNLPSLDRLSDLVGRKVSRSEVDEVAEGYTRAKARAAQQ